MHTFSITALHGFMGAASNWAPFSEFLHPLELGQADLDLSSWAKAFNATIVRKKKSKNFLLGYSLGGRLAMHALLADPSLWDGAIFISAHPGLATKHAREARLKSDLTWANRFLNDPWQPLMDDWNRNPIFGNAPFPFSSHEKMYDRAQLSKQLIHWSLGKQTPLLESLAKLSVPMMVLAGENDPKFCAIALQFASFAQVHLIPDAAHRVPWDAPTKFTEKIKQYLAQEKCF